MPPPTPRPERFIGLDLHKHYFVPCGVDSDLHEVLAPRRVLLSELDAWRRRHVTSRDAIVLEMTTNALQCYDELAPHAHSVTVVHPPHVALITRAQVMTDRIAARTLARLHAKGLLTGIWIPPAPVRELRALIAERAKMTRLATQAKNRLHAVLHRHHWLPPAGDPFKAASVSYWLSLPVSALEHACLRCDLETLQFAQQQQARLMTSLTAAAAQDERVPLLVQLPGVSLLTALTILGALGDCARFPSARHLVGYAGLGARVHDSGQTRREGAITKAGRRDLRSALVEAAQSAANTHPHWQAELARLEPRLGRNKAIVAIARKLLVAVWHVLTKETADRYAEPQSVARKLLRHAYLLGRANRPPGQKTGAYVRQQLDRLSLGADLQAIPWGRKQRVPLPPSGPPQDSR